MTETAKLKTDLNVGVSVWALLARSSFLKILALTVLLAAAETALICHRLGNAVPPGTLETCVEEGLVPPLFLAALGAAFFILLRTESLLGNVGQYTMMRLRIGPTAVFIRKTVYNVLCLLVLFAAQIWLIFWFAWLYGRIPEAQGAALPGENRQLLFLAFYRSEFLHCLLPMAETGKWVRNALCLLALGMDAAGSIGKRYRISHLGLLAVTMQWFTSPIGTGWQDVLCCILSGVVIGADLRNIYKSGRERKS